MRTIISNDLKRLYGKIDYELIERTRLSTKVLLAATTLPVLNSSGFAANDFICVNDPGKEASEIRQVNSISGQNINVSTPTAFAYENKTNLYKLGYDLIKFYGDATVIATATIKPDNMVSVPVTLSNSVAYTMSFFNTSTGIETAKGEAVYTTDNLLCSSGDVSKYESITILGANILDKIDIASRDLRNVFRAQAQNIKDVDDRDLLRSACALSALRYIFIELNKNPDDVAATKAQQYRGMYDNEVRRITEVINVEDANVRVIGQTRCVR